MIIYNEIKQIINGNTRTLIETKSINPAKQLIQHPTEIIYGNVVVDLGHLENGFPVYNNGYSYTEGEETDKPIEETDIKERANDIEENI